VKLLGHQDSVMVQVSYSAALRDAQRTVPMMTSGEQLRNEGARISCSCFWSMALGCLPEEVIPACVNITHEAGRGQPRPGKGAGRASRITGFPRTGLQ
jgi:hypothetical protein